MSGMLTALVALVCIVAEGFFSGSELALINAEPLLLQAKKAQGNKGAALLLYLLEKPHYLISTSLVGTNIAVVSATAVVTMYFLDAYGSAGELYAVLIMTPLILIFGEMVPKTIYQNKADAWAPVIVYPKFVFYILFMPFARPLGLLGDLILFIMSGGGKRHLERHPLLSREEFKRMILYDDITHGGDLKREEKRMVSRIIDFGEDAVEDVMVPLIEVTAIPAEKTVSEIIELIEEEGFSRYPVYEERIDNIVGILNTFDVLCAADPNALVGDLMRSAKFVPENMPVEILLEQMQKNNVSITVVVDEFGGAVGIITMEDIIEEIVGEIDDEYDEPGDAPSINRVSRNQFLMDARVEIDTVNEIHPGLIPEGDYATLSGLALEHFKRIPDVGESFSLDSTSLTVEIINTTDKAIQSVLLTIPPGFVRRRLRKKQLRKAIDTAGRQG